MKALIFKYTDERWDAGYYDYPWKDIVPDSYIEADAEAGFVMNQGKDETILYLDGDKPVLLISHDDRTENNSWYLNHLWNNWP